MYLKSLELSGFKSFAKKTTLDFNVPISSIVGPNGSGKSNVAEAFRFVLGEQSLKSLRGKRGEDMIFNGSRTMPRLNRASVKVVFDNSRRLLNIDFDEVVIERQVHRDGVNEYILNGSQVRLRDVVELLAGAHVGPSGHHIISQGEADKILNANLKERRVMVEEALGLKVYQYKKQESERKLEKTRENIASVTSLRREIAPHIKFLKKQVEKIEKSREIKNELTGFYQEYFSYEESYLNIERKKLEHESKIVETERIKLDGEILEAKKILAASSGSDEKSKAIIDLEGKLRSVRVSKDNLYREIGRIEGEISGEEKRLVRLKEAGVRDERKMILLSDIESLSKDVERKADEALANGTIELLKVAILKIKESFIDFISKNRTGRDEVSILESQNEIEKLKKEKESFEIKISDIKKEEEKLALEYADLKENIDKEKDKSREAEKDVFRLMALQNEISSRVNYIRSRQESFRLEDDDYKREIAEASALLGQIVLRFEAKVLTSEEEFIKALKVEQIARRRNIEKLKIRLEELGGGVGEDVLKEFKDAEERDIFLSKEIEDLERSASSLEILIQELDQTLDKEFKEGIVKINSQFLQFFQLMFGGGSASLLVVRPEKRKRKKEEDGLDETMDLSEEEDEEEGIDISVALPNKKTKGLEMLSGGERALTSIALLFAISQVNPPPFIILDETDAALDEANSRKYGDMIQNLAKYSQLILITHNRETMSRAGILYGVTMGSDGCSKILSVRFEEAVAVAK